MSNAKRPGNLHFVVVPLETEIFATQVDDRLDTVGGNHGTQLVFVQLCRPIWSRSAGLCAKNALSATARRGRDKACPTARWFFRPPGRALVQLGSWHELHFERSRLYQSEHIPKQANTLSDQKAWDVATFIDSQERPQDPRFSVSVAETRTKYHHSPISMYGQLVNGVALGPSASLGARPKE